jgi:hypothetical protein
MEPALDAEDRIFSQRGRTGGALAIGFYGLLGLGCKTEFVIEQRSEPVLVVIAGKSVRGNGNWLRNPDDFFAAAASGPPTSQFVLDLEMFAAFCAVKSDRHASTSSRGASPHRPFLDCRREKKADNRVPDLHFFSPVEFGR